MSRVLYFVGAGLTKSLALQAHPIPAMFDFITTAAEYLFDQIVLTTLAALEIAEPYPYAWGTPLCRTLADQLLDRNQQPPPDLQSRFRQALRDKPSESVEDLLDRTGGRASNLPSQTADLRFQYALVRIFALIEWQVNWHPLDTFLRCQFQNRDSAHTFVSFNYDLVLDHAIERCRGRLDLLDIYGFRPIGGIVSDPTGNPPGARITALRQQQASELDTFILKPHGSLNWWAKGFQTGTPADEVWRDATVVIPITESGGVRYVLSTHTQQWVHLPDELGFLVEPVILTPRSVKKPEREFLANIRLHEEQAICSAEEVFILGWSIPRTDVDQEDLIRNAVSKRATPFRRVTVVNRNAGVEYFKRVKDIFAVADPNLLRICNSGFEQFSVSQASAAY